MSGASQERSRRVDAAIIGAGPAGSALALGLARDGWRVALVEAGCYDRFRIGESLPPNCTPRLQRLGVWREFQTLDPRPTHGVLSAWGSSNLESSSFLGHPCVNGWVVDRRRFDGMLAEAAAAAGAELWTAARLRDVQQTHEQCWQLDVAGKRGAMLQARYLVDATGRQARVAARLGAARVPVDRLVGIALSFVRPQGTSCEPRPTMVESSSDGWWYTASLPEDRELAVFMTDSDICRRESLTLAPRLLERLAQAPHTRRRLRDCRPAGPLQVFSASSHTLPRAAGPGWLAVGDAAAGRDPLSSSGVDFALASAELARVALARDASATDRPALAYYERAVRRDFDVYAEQRAFFYAQEQRWPEAPFWRRRQGHDALFSSDQNMTLVAN